jgi:hypothetical protein
MGGLLTLLGLVMLTSYGVAQSSTRASKIMRTSFSMPAFFAHHPPGHLSNYACAPHLAGSADAAPIQTSSFITRAHCSTDGAVAALCGYSAPFLSATFLPCR